jgi:hypothetical protein
MAKQDGCMRGPNPLELGQSGSLRAIQPILDQGPSQAALRVELVIRIAAEIERQASIASKAGHDRLAQAGHLQFDPPEERNGLLHEIFAIGLDARQFQSPILSGRVATPP